jgi:hypothetical protein
MNAIDRDKVATNTIEIARISNLRGQIQSLRELKTQITDTELIRTIDAMLEVINERLQLLKQAREQKRESIPRIDIKSE